MKRKQPTKRKIAIFYLHFLLALITIALLIAISNYCYLIKYQNKKIKKTFITIS